MPYRVQERNCTKSDGEDGSAVLKKQNRDGTWKVMGCYDNAQDANAIKSRLEEMES